MKKTKRMKTKRSQMKQAKLTRTSNNQLTNLWEY